MTAYTHFQHRHIFATWAASRAAQRGLGGGSVKVLVDALKSCGVSGFLKKRSSLHISQSTFDRLQRRWCKAIMRQLRRRGVRDATFGRAAKLVAVYLKSMVVVGPHCESNLAKVAHPPIDRRLLKSLSRDKQGKGRTGQAARQTWGTINWTDLDEAKYYEVINQLRSCLRKSEPLWRLERYWTPAD